MKLDRSYKISQMIILGVLLTGVWYVNGSSALTTKENNDSVNYFSEALEGPFSIHVIEADLSNEDVSLMAWRSGGLTTSSRQMMDAKAAGNSVLGGINADFFSFQTTLPIGNQVTDGEWVYGIHSRRSHVLQNESGDIIMEPVSFYGEISLSDGRTVSVTGVNRHRANDQAMFYNHHYQGISRNDSTGYELVISLVRGEKWLAGNTVRVVVDQAIDGYGTSINSDQKLLSIGRNHSDYETYKTISALDTLSLYLGFGNSDLNNITQVVGGGGRILRDGVDATNENQEIEGIAKAFLQNRHPRSVVAVNQDGSKLWLLVIDGRQASSLGMNFPEMADYLTKLGAWNAVNLDGGGSSTMIFDQKVVNSPSDPIGERSVTNVLMLVGK